jgi:hypothetical protein
MTALDPAERLLELARATGAPSLAIVGTSKNAGKSVVIGALAAALDRARTPYGLCTIGRDGESSDAIDGSPKPRFFLRPGAFVTLPAALVPRSPALEILADTGEASALGRILLGRVRAAGIVEIAGPPGAAALRRVAEALRALAGFVLIDGAVDRIATLRGGSDAVIVAVGAATAPTEALAVEEAAALVARLSLPLERPGAPAVYVAGALTAQDAAEYVRAGETRAIVVPDATHIAFGGRTFRTFVARLDLRCRRRLQPIACTIASRSPARTFEPRAFARAVAERTGLPTFDIYAGSFVGADWRGGGDFDVNSVSDCDGGSDEVADDARGDVA